MLSVKFTLVAMIGDFKSNLFELILIFKSTESEGSSSLMLFLLMFVLLYGELADIGWGRRFFYVKIFLPIM
jgi:hypothetical protein